MFLPFTDEVVIEEELLLMESSAWLVNVFCDLATDRRGAGWGGISFVGEWFGISRFIMWSGSTVSPVAVDPAFVLRNLLRLLMSLSLRKSGTSKLISVPR